MGIAVSEQKVKHTIEMLLEATWDDMHEQGAELEPKPQAVHDAMQRVTVIGGVTWALYCSLLVSDHAFCLAQPVDAGLLDGQSPRG